MNLLDFPAWSDAPAAVAAALAAAFVAGSMVGSFLNVVAHRVPRGKTVVHGRSHCPACGGTIRARDNVPVLGWLLLRGRCRDCGAAIAARYPLVEAACGGLAATIAAVEIAAAPEGEPQTALIAWCGRSALALTIVAWALLAERGHFISGVTVGVAAAAAALIAVFVTPLCPLPPACADEAWTSPANWAGRLVAALVGLTAGWATGRAAGGRTTQAACSVVGAALGWQGAVLATLAAAVLRVLVRHPAAGSLAAVAALLGRHPLAAAWEAVCRRWTGG